MDNIDITQKTDEELSALIRAITVEQSRRKTIADAEKEAEELAQRYSEAIGRMNGDEWVQPTGAHDAYVATALVEHEGKIWESLISGNVWEPGVSGWREYVPEGGAPPEWVQPTGGHDAYQMGDQVTFEGKVYESLLDGNVWSPADYPQGWQELVEDEPEEPEHPEEPEEPEEPEDPAPVEPTDPEEPEPGNGDGDEDEEPTEPDPEPYPDPEEPEIPEIPEEPTPEEPVEPEDPVEPSPEDPEEPTDPEEPVVPEPEPEEPEIPEEPTPEVPEWVQPTGGHDAYNIGDQVLFEGVIYESVINGNSWSPAVYPQGWKVL